MNSCTVDLYVNNTSEAGISLNTVNCGVLLCAGLLTPILLIYVSKTSETGISLNTVNCGVLLCGGYLDTNSHTADLR